MDWKEQLAQIKVTQVSVDPYAKLKEMVSRVRHYDDECMMVISNKQRNWLEGLFELADNNAWNRFSPNSIKFLETCASGFYLETPLPKYEE